MTGRRLLPWVAIAALTACLTAISVVQALRQYQELRTGWSWDLAYYNQWFWSLTRGDGILSVRPVASYAVEGPPAWKMNYLAPVRLLILPFYAIHPDPRTLLIIQCVVFWWVVPAAYTLVRSESGSDGLALSAAFLVPLTPLLWPLALNDFRELQLAIPFVIWAVQGVRGRNVGLASAAIAMMLACRQEFAVMVSTFAFLPPRDPEPLSRTLRWRYSLFALGLAWLMFGFFGYLRLAVGRAGPNLFMNDFLGPKASVLDTVVTMADLLGYGLGSWAILACFAPRVAILALPWVWSLCNGRWSLRYLSTDEWHHVRYTVLPVVGILASGLIGYARMGAWLMGRSRGTLLHASLWLAAVLGCLPGLGELAARVDRIPHPIGRDEAEVIRGWIDKIGPEDGVLSAYEVAAPLSSRRELRSYRLPQNKPEGFPILGPHYRWVFLCPQGPGPQIFLEQGFREIHRGEFLTILHR